jgi:hypothetical protein
MKCPESRAIGRGRVGSRSADTSCKLGKHARWGRISQGTQFPGEMQRSVAESLSQLAQELLAEAAAEQAHGKKEGPLTARDPAGTVR